MLTLDNIGIKLFVLASMKEHWLYLLFMLCSTTVKAIQIVVG